MLISKRFEKFIKEHYKINTFDFFVLHDAARLIQNKNSIKNKDLIEFKKTIFRSRFNVGYFGHLYDGRGVEIITKLAKLNPKFIFLIFGGEEVDLIKIKQKTKLKNIKFFGFINPLVKMFPTI